MGRVSNIGINKPENVLKDLHPWCFSCCLGQLHQVCKLDMFKGGIFRCVRSFENTLFKNRPNKRESLPDSRLEVYNIKKEKRIKVGKRKKQPRVYQGPALSPKYTCIA